MIVREMTVAETILEQLDGGRFRAMTGAKNFSSGVDRLTFTLPGSGNFCRNGINYVEIVLNAMDTYDVTFYRHRGAGGGVIRRVVASCEGVYCDQLKGVFVRETGLAISL